MHKLLRLILLGFFILGPYVASWADESSETSFIIAIPPLRSTETDPPLSNMTRDTLLYMMSLFLNPTEGSLNIIRTDSNEGQNWVLVPVSAVFPDSITSFRKASREDSPLKVFQIFKELLKTSTYLKVRAWHHFRFIIPDTLEEFKALYPFHNWEKELVKKSAVKGTRRVIYRSPKPWPYISVAQTETFPNQTVRETEVIIAREDLSGHYDFYAYDRVGKLTQTSLFHTSHGKDVVAPVPFTCLACHYSGTQGVFQRSPDSYHSASAK